MLPCADDSASIRTGTSTSKGHQRSLGSRTSALVTTPATAKFEISTLVAIKLYTTQVGCLGTEFHLDKRCKNAPVMSPDLRSSWDLPGIPTDPFRGCAVDLGCANIKDLTRLASMLRWPMTAAAGTVEASMLRCEGRWGQQNLEPRAQPCAADSSVDGELQKITVQYTTFQLQCTLQSLHYITFQSYINECMTAYTHTVTYIYFNIFQYISYIHLSTLR